MHPFHRSSDILSVRDISESDNVPHITERGRCSTDFGFLLNEPPIDNIGDLREFASGGSRLDKGDN